MTENPNWQPEPTERQRTAGQLISLVEAIASAEVMVSSMESLPILGGRKFDDGRFKLETATHALRTGVVSYLAECLRIAFERDDKPYSAAERHAEQILSKYWPAEGPPPAQNRTGLVSLLRAFADGTNLLGLSWG